MNYPVWDLSVYGGGLLIALIATIHVYIAHFAVGGGLFLVVTEIKARREDNNGILDYVHSHTGFFLLLTMVLGSLTGVGIWLVISVLNPAATSILIHTFIFGWATEWVFFVVEIISLLIYYYTFYGMSARNHIRIGWIYFIAAWLSLVIIDGIISFMLTPGNWLQNKGFWSGFLNPSFPPSLLFRIALALIFAGVYGFITSTNIKDHQLRKDMTRYCVLWLLLPFVLLIPSAYWYMKTISSQAQEMIMGSSPETFYFTKYFLGILPLVVLGGLVMALRLPRSFHRTVAFIILVIAFLYMGAFEMVRESSRRPYIIYDHMYSNSMLKTSLPQVQEQGVLASAKWTMAKEVTGSNQLDAGKELFRLLCLSCHSVGGIRNDILVRTEDMELEEINSIFDEMGEGLPFMPPFAGIDKERAALGSYIYEVLMGMEEEIAFSNGS
ncbi:MAG: cytochrome c [Thermodesulfobacteriota bacterium]|nr:cytochrome c [Thermodesulfobacteriota bacterium]